MAWVCVDCHEKVGCDIADHAARLQEMKTVAEVEWEYRRNTSYGKCLYCKDITHTLDCEKAMVIGVHES